MPAVAPAQTSVRAGAVTSSALNRDAVCVFQVVSVQGDLCRTSKASVCLSLCVPAWKETRCIQQALWSRKAATLGM